MAAEERQFAPAVEVSWILASGTLDEDRRRAATALINTVPADEVLSALASDGLVPLAYRHLVASHTPGLDERIAAGLTAEFHRHATTRFLFARRLRELLEVLESAGVRVVPYKGPALAIQLYGNYAMRQFGDLDLLVHPADADRAHDALLATGLESRHPASSAWATYLQQRRHSETFFDRKLCLPVELHWAVADRFHGVDLDVGWLLQQTERIDLLGRPTNVMSGARLLLALCLHGMKHLWERRVWLGEIGELIRQRPDLDWSAAFDCADRHDFGRSLRATLLVVRHLLQIAPPDPWVRQLDRDLDARRLADALIARVETIDPSPDRLSDRFLLGLQARTGLRRRATFLWRVATDFSERDAARLLEPPRFPFWHAVLRGMRLIRQADAERGSVRS